MKRFCRSFVRISVLVSVILLSACSTPRSSSSFGGANPSEIVDIYTGSRNQVDLVISSDPITYTIDISTAEGRAKLQDLTLPEAEGLAIREAVMQSKCAKLVDPQFTNLMKGKRVLRITVYGFPAKYRNK